MLVHETILLGFIIELNEHSKSSAGISELKMTVLLEYFEHSCAFY